MDIKARLEKEHSKELTDTIIQFVGNNELRFKHLIQLFFDGESRISQRAVWPISHIVIEHPTLLKPYMKKLVSLLNKKGKHPAIDRNILRIFQTIKLPKAYEGIIIDICFRIVPSEYEPIASRAFAITTACNICKKYPELKNEFLLILQEMQNVPQSPAVKVRMKLAVKELSIRNSKH